MISVEALIKDYKVHRRQPGLKAALASVFHRPYETVRAVDNISFKIEAGDRVGFLGPNGAGKTTTLKILAGLLHPTSGQVQVNKFQPFARRAEFLRQITLVAGQKQQLLWDLPPTETYELNRAIFDVERQDYRRRLDEMIELLQIGTVINQPTRQLSLGERMKCELVAALIHKPQVLFLDEPTLGLDVTMQAVVRRFIKEYNERYGATVLLTSHYMADVSALCPRIMVINHGQLIYDGAQEELIRTLRPEKRVNLRLGQPVTRSEVEALGGRVVTLTDELAELQVLSGQLNQLVSMALSRLPVIDLTVEDAPLEEVVSELFQGGAAALKDKNSLAANLSQGTTNLPPGAP